MSGTVKSNKKFDALQEYQSIFSAIPAGLLIVDLKYGKILKSNHLLCEILSLSEDDLKNGSWSTIHPFNKLDTVIDQYLEHSLSGEDVIRAFPWQNGRGETITRDISARPISFEGENAILFYFHAINTVGEVSQDLSVTTSIFEKSRQAFVIADEQLKIVKANDAFREIIKPGASEITGKKLNSVELWGDNAFPLGEVQKSLAETGYWQGVIYNSVDSKGRHTKVSINAIKKEEDSFSQYIAIFYDVTADKIQEEKLRKLALYDQLTGLPNRILYQERIEQAIREGEEEDKQVALLFLDLDRFKKVNNTFGHQAGDRMLNFLARRLSECVNERDTVARYGGDEFVFILRKVDNIQRTAIVAQRIIDALTKPFILESLEVYLHASIGIAIYPTDGKNAAELLKGADAAMYHAKGLGNNRFQFYSQEMDVTVHENIELENDLKSAVDNGELSLHYQPQFDLFSEGLQGIEALLRWTHPKLGMVPPDKFIPLAEENGIINPIGDWVLKTACLQLKQWSAVNTYPLRMAVNLSGRQIQQLDIVQSIDRILAETGVPPSQLELELTESIIMEIDESTVQKLHEIKALGVSLSIDDFGTGYSSINYLKRFPVDSVKIDQSFTKEVTTNPDTAAIVRAIISLCHSLKMTVIAEGVETQEQLEFLKDANCDMIQGFLLGKPMAPDLFDDSFFPELSALQEFGRKQ
jgi:diguanylate cyclase (GGDEF)-like protein/PAS domain S-box-containing protein